jgi:DNA ligase-1
LKQQLDLEVKNFFDLLASTSSIKAKKQLLAERRDDGNVKKYLDYLLNPFFVTGISEKKIRKVVSVERPIQFHSFDELMAYVRKNHTGSDDILASVQAYLDSVNPELRTFYIGIITKTIRVGCDAKTVNDALGYEFIPQWEVQQAYQIGKLKMNENEWFSLSQKLNGVRGTYFEGKLISRQGKEFTGLEHILEDIQQLIPNSDEWVVDGELIRKNVEHISDNENFRLTTGILSQEDGDKRQIQLVIFDILPKAEFLRGESQLRYRDRLEQLKDLEQRIQRRNLSNLRIVDVLYTGNDMSMISKCLDRMIAEGKEGLMLNRNCKYFTRRHNGILKVKQFYTVDLEIVDLEEGTGRLSGTLGAFVVRYKNNYLRVGSGMTDDQRKKFWDDGLNLIGRVIEVKYKDESYDRRTGLRSLQFPTFVQLRELGKQESYD